MQVINFYFVELFSYHKMEWGFFPFFKQKISTNMFKFLVALSGLLATMLYTEDNRIFPSLQKILLTIQC